MTCRLQEISPLDSLYARCQAYPGGVAALAHRMSDARGVRVSTGVLYNKLRRTGEHHRLTLDEFELLLGFLAEARVEGWFYPLQAFAWSQGFLLVEMPTALSDASEEIMNGICTAVQQQGLAISEIGHALANDLEIDSKEMAAIELRAADTMNAFARLWETVRQLHQRALNLGLVR